MSSVLVSAPVQKVMICGESCPAEERGDAES